MSRRIFDWRRERSSVRSIRGFHQALAILTIVTILLFGFGQSTLAQQPESPLVSSFRNYQKLKKESRFGLNWISLGPLVNSARVEAVQLVPERPGWMYVAFGSGGLWKTTNNGNTWQSIFEGHASCGIGDFALAPSNPDVIYLGTGESLKKARNFTIPGTGVYRSDDGGKSWQHCGLSDTWHIGEIAVHPINPDVVIVAALGHFWSKNRHRGLFRTEDGGKTWKQVLNVGDRVGANDVVWAKDDTDIVYASTWENFPTVNGKGSAVYRSENGGRSWQKCEGGLPSGDSIGRIGLAVSQTDGKKVYALIDHRGKIKEGAALIFKSIDGGKTWERTHQDPLMIFSRIGWYFADIYVNPQNDEEIFGLGVRVAQSVDGGKTFKLLSGKVRHATASVASGLHLDHCEMWIHPKNPNHLVLGNDGGLYQSFDRGESWMHFNNLPTGEFYDLAIDQGPDAWVYAGAQDNATVFGKPIPLDASDRRPWKYLWIDPWNGGDGCVTQVDPVDSNRVYFSAQEGAFRRKNLKTDRSVRIRPALPKGHKGKLSFNFVAPMILSPHDSRRLYLGGNYLFRSSNRGDDWDVISPDLSRSKDTRRESKATSTIAESTRVEGLIYAGTDRGGFWVSENGGRDWRERSEGLPIGYIRSIVPSRYHDSRVYLAMSGINYDDLATWFYCSEDKGVTWKRISANLDNEPANVILEDPWRQNVLYAGTFRGVYLSTNRGQSWELLGKNLPACSISDMDIHKASLDLIVATHGRGIYKMNLAPLKELLDQGSIDANQNLLLATPIVRRPYLSDTRPGTNFRKFDPATLSFWLVNPGKIKISILKKSGDELVSFDVEGKRGFNQFQWDLVLKEVTSPLPYFIQYRKYLDAGDYRIQIQQVGAKALEGTLKVIEGRREEK